MDRRLRFTKDLIEPLRVRPGSAVKPAPRLRSGRHRSGHPSGGADALLAQGVDPAAREQMAAVRDELAGELAGELGRESG
jgi:hypothetical protein